MRVDLKELRAIRDELVQFLDVVSKLDAVAVKEGLDRANLIHFTLQGVIGLQKVSELLAEREVFNA